MKLPLSLKPSRFQIALLLALLPIFVLGDRVANFTRGGTIKLTVSRDQRFVAIHHLGLWNYEHYGHRIDFWLCGWFDRFRVLERDSGRLVAIPKRTFLWNDGQYLKEIDGKWFLAISCSTFNNDLCWVQRIDKNTLARDKPRWIPGRPIAWSNGKILCKYEGRFTIVDENDTSQKQEVSSSSWISLSELKWFAQSEKLASIALNDKLLKRINSRGDLVDAHISDQEITLLIRKDKDRTRPKEQLLVVEKIRISTGERTLRFEFPIPARELFSYHSKLMNNGQTALLYSPAGVHVFDIPSQEMKLNSKDFFGFRFAEMKYDPWIVMEKKPNFYFLNTKTFEKSRPFPIPPLDVISQLPVNDTEYLVPNSQGELELRNIQSDALLHTYCEHRNEPILRTVLIACIVIWQVLWWWSNRSNKLLYPIIVAASLVCIVYPLWMRVKYQGIEEVFGVLANGMMSGVITGLVSASWIGLLLGRGNFALRFLYFSICIFAAGGVLLQQQESNTVLFHMFCIAMLLVMLLPLLLARWINWRLPIEGIQDSQESRFQLSLASLLVLGTSIALIMGAVRYDPYMCEVYLRHIDQSKHWRVIIILGCLLAIPPLAFLQYCSPKKRLYLRSGILVGSVTLTLFILVKLSSLFIEPEMLRAVSKGYYLGWIGLHVVVCLLHWIPTWGTCVSFDRSVDRIGAR